MGNPSKQVTVTKNEFHALEKLWTIMYEAPFDQRDSNALLGFLPKIEKLYPKKGGN